MSSWRLYYHLVWSTKHREPLLDAETMAVIQQSLRDTCRKLNIIPHAIGGVPDHLHMVVSIPPRVAVADAVGRFKGASAHACNRMANRPDQWFGWQAQYGVLSFGEKALMDVIAYVQDQPARHQADHLIPGLERTEDV